MHVVEAHWNKDFYDELEIFDGSGKTKDDQVDCVSDCFTLLNKDMIIPTFNLADFSSSSPVDRLSSGVTVPTSGLSISELTN